MGVACTKECRNWQELRSENFFLESAEVAPALSVHGSAASANQERPCATLDRPAVRTFASSRRDTVCDSARLGNHSNVQHARLVAQGLVKMRDDSLPDFAPGEVANFPSSACL